MTEKKPLETEIENIPVATLRENNIIEDALKALKSAVKDTLEEIDKKGNYVCPYCGADDEFDIPTICHSCGKGDKPWIKIVTVEKAKEIIRRRMLKEKKK